MEHPDNVSRRVFVKQSLAAGAIGVAAGGVRADTPPVQPPPTPRAIAASVPASKAAEMPCGVLGKTKISRIMLGGNLVSGYLHCRDLKYVHSLFRAYATEAKMMETMALAEAYGINTLFETGANFVQKYNREFGGKMQFIPHIEVSREQTETALTDHIKKQVDSGAIALYVWGVSADQLVAADAVDKIGRAVELAKKHNLPVGVGGHSLLVPMACEKTQVPCDFYVKTFHNDDYPSATPKELRKEFIWLSGGKGWYDNMWCINPEETAAFMKTVTKPWVAFKVLAAGAYRPEDGFKFAVKNGADFMAVGMFDFQVKENCSCAVRVFKEFEKRERPWRA
ncbi:MAG: hypothetical protein ACHRHE_03220 [Tepidisphaerales bacterium]